MSRLIVISNRVGDFKSGFHAGGLSVALCEMLRSTGGLWIGTTTVEETSEKTWARSPLELKQVAPDVSVGNVPISKKQYDSFYFDYSNSALWPICHNRIDLARFNKQGYKDYRAVNRRLADAVAPHIADDDTVWVHDYHLIPLGMELRKRGVSNPIGFFMHIPFPAGDIFAALSEHEDLAESLAHYDLVGFQTQKDVAAFLAYLQRHLDGNILNNSTVRVNGLQLRCASFPIGIDAEDFAAAARVGSGPGRSRGPTAPDMDHVIGVDRLDYSKGLTQRFRSFGEFLSMHPHRVGKVTYTQIAPPTRVGLDAYTEIRQELEQLGGSINGRFGTLDWVPIHYIHRAYPRKELAQLYRRARVGLVTPTQDGMNLVAKEYVAAQDPDNPGVLVLSKFAGAAEQLRSGALLINPYDIEQCAKAIEGALTMKLEERQQRYRVMAANVFEKDIENWRETFLRELERSAEGRLRHSREVARFLASQFDESLSAAS